MLNTNKSRLELYHKFINQFDLIDQKSLYAFDSLNDFEINKLVLQSQFVKTSNMMSFNRTAILMKSLCSEWIFSQRFFLKGLGCSSFKSNINLILTIRKENLFWFLEKCLSSFFLIEQCKLVFKKEQNLALLKNKNILSKLDFYCPIKLYNLIFIFHNDFNSLILHVNFKNKQNLKDKALSLYFIPAQKI